MNGRTTPKAPTSSKNNSRHVVIDWNVIQYWLSKQLRTEVDPILESLDEVGLQRAMSDISIFEAQCQLPVAKHTESHDTLKTLYSFPIDPDLLLILGTLTCCYRDHEKTKGHAKDISLQDGINAATAVQNNALILTADFNDYPRPFFDEVYHWSIKDSKDRIYKIYLLTPDIAQIEATSKKWRKTTTKDKTSSK